jgi:hypothetical protein
LRLAARFGVLRADARVPVFRLRLAPAVFRLAVVRFRAAGRVDRLFAVGLRAGRFLAVFADFLALDRVAPAFFRADARPRLDAFVFAELRV